MRHRQRGGFGWLHPGTVPAMFLPGAVPGVLNETSREVRREQPASTLQSDLVELETYLRSQRGLEAGAEAGAGAAGAVLVPEPASYPWTVAPPGYESFLTPGVIATPANTGVDNTVLTLTVPNGYYGVLNKLTHYYSSPSLVPGSGDITWRITRDNQAIKNFGAITVEFGREQPWPIDGIPMLPGQVFRYIVNHAAASVLPSAGTFIIVFFGGYFYPQQYERSG